MDDAEKARRLFQEAGLTFPNIPAELAVRLKERGKWVFSTREIQMSPYNLQHYACEFDRNDVEDYVILSHSGHGVNSYALQYYVVYGVLRMFLHLGWGGVYMDAEADAKKIRECFSLADEIIHAVHDPGRVPADLPLMIVGSDFYGCCWLLGQNRRELRKSMDHSKAPAVVLTEVLQSLSRPTGSCYQESPNSGNPLLLSLARQDDTPQGRSLSPVVCGRRALPDRLLPLAQRRADVRC